MMPDHVRLRDFVRASVYPMPSSSSSSFCRRLFRLSSSLGDLCVRGRDRDELRLLLRVMRGERLVIDGRRQWPHPL